MPIRLIAKAQLSAAIQAHAAGLALAWRALVNAVGASLMPTEDEAWRTDAQSRLHRKGSRNSMMIMPAAAFLIALAFAPWVSAALRYGWFGAMTVICLAADYSNRRLDRITGRDAKTVGRKSQIATVMSVFFLTAWCSMGVVFWVADAPQDQMLLVLILACSMAGTVAVSASHPAIAVAGLMVHAIFLIGPAAVTGTELDTMLALLSTIFTVLVCGQLVTLSQGTNRLLTLEHERTELVRDLRSAKNDSDRERGRAVSAGRAKSQFLSHMNHELRTPMNAILGFSEIIKSKAFGNDVDKYAEYATIIHDSGNHLLSLINGMLDLAKIDGGKLSLRETEVNLSLLIAETIEASEAEVRQAHISLTSNVQHGLPSVSGDDRALRQIVINLLSNAIKFTQPNGCVRVFAGVEPDGRMAFGVEDTGLGIAREDQAYVFERFGHGRSDVTTQQKGTGLGLAIVKGFADAHDGSVALESEPGAGTRVTVYLPKDRIIARDDTRLVG